MVNLAQYTEVGDPHLYGYHAKGRYDPLVDPGLKEQGRGGAQLQGVFCVVIPGCIKRFMASTSRM